MCAHVGVRVMCVKQPTLVARVMLAMRPSLEGAERVWGGRTHRRGSDLRHGGDPCRALCQHVHAGSLRDASDATIPGGGPSGFGVGAHTGAAAI